MSADASESDGDVREAPTLTCTLCEQSGRVVDLEAPSWIDEIESAESVLELECGHAVLCDATMPDVLTSGVVDPDVVRT